MVRRNCTELIKSAENYSVAVSSKKEKNKIKYMRHQNHHPEAIFAEMLLLTSANKYGNQ
jgi:hypothetical protein